MLYPTLDDSNGLGRNIGYAGQARQQRFADYANAISRGATPNIGGPLPDPSWDAFWGAMHDTQDRAADNGMNFRVRFPSLAGLTAAAGRRSQG